MVEGFRSASAKFYSSLAATRLAGRLSPQLEPPEIADRYFRGWSGGRGTDFRVWRTDFHTYFGRVYDKIEFNWGANEMLTC